MPGIVVFRRRWMVASDDFVIPFAIAFVVRGIWFLVLAVSLGIHHAAHNLDWSSPKDQHLCQQTMDYYVGGYLALLFATNIMEASIAWMSAKGSIMDTEPRSLIPALLYVRLMLSVIEVVWLSVGIKWIWLDTMNCSMTDEIVIARAVVVFNWLFLFVVVVIMYCTFDTAGQSWFELQQARSVGQSDSVDAPDGSHKYKMHITQKYERRWQGCFRYAFCCRGEGQGDENVYAFIGRTLSEYFQDLDVVPSDFASGLVLLRRHQKWQEQVELERALEERRIQDMTTDGVPLKKSSLRYQRTNNAQTLRLDCKEELLVYKEIAYYMNYALAAYGWPIYMKNNIGCGCCRLLKSFRCCYCCRSMDKRLHKSVHVEEDNCCRCHFSALKKIAGFHNTDVIYCSYHNDMYKSPFYVALDHTKKTVVIVIRGTLSLQDILTDFSVEPERIPVEDGDSSWFGHKGMVRCAVYIQNKLINEGILQKAFNADPACGTQSYRLIVLGHSLGAGTAAILAFLLRPRYPDLFCYAYSPPGANLSMSAAQYAKDFVISVVIGKDMIPRLSLFTLEDLRNNIMVLVTKSRMSKWKILRGCACRCAFACCYACKCVKFENKRDELDAEIENILIPEITHSSSIRFYPPGRILHVVKTCSVNHGFGRTETMFEPVWAGLEEFQSIKISGLMWKDHMPDFVLEALNKCLPSKEHEQAVLSGPGQPRPGTLEVPTSDWYSRAVIDTSSMHDSLSFKSDEFSVEVPSVRVHQPAQVIGKNLGNPGSSDSISIEAHKDQREICPRYTRTVGSPQVPLARPESAIDDSDLEDSATSSRISTTWKDFNLPVVEQSFDSFSLSRSHSKCEVPISPVAVKSLCTTPTVYDPSIDKVFSTQSIPTTQYLAMSHPPPTKYFAKSHPPPKPPRTFETEQSKGLGINRTFKSVVETNTSPSRTFETTRSKEWGFNGTCTSNDDTNRSPSSGIVGPPKPPRTFQYVMVDSASYSYDLNYSPSPSPDGRLLPMLNGVEHSGKSSSIKFQNFVNNSNPVKVNTNPSSYLSYSSTVTYLQDKSCLMLCNGCYEPTPPSNDIVERSRSYKSTNSYSRCFSEERISIHRRQPIKFDQKPFSFKNRDIKPGLNGEADSSSTDQKVVIRTARGNRNKSKRQAMYWDEDETTRLLQFSSSCSDIPDRSIDDRTRELDNGILETWL